MLVLIDGRTVYTPLFSGVFWEAQDVMLEDVERIEVVTGRITALWGTNAVDGLIQIINKPAAATRGAFAGGEVGNRERGGAVRFGGETGSGENFRIYGKSYDRSTSHRADGSSINDAADGMQVGFRADWSRQRDAFTVQGDAHRGTIDQAPAARKFSRANVVGRWQRSLDDGAELSAQAYVDHTERDHPQSFSEILDTVDAVAQYTFRAGEAQRLTLGGSYDYARDRVAPSPALAFIPGSRSLSWARVFAQDQIELTPTLTMALAASLEGNPYTGIETLPSVRVARVPQSNHTLWASLSRAVRAPSRIDREFFSPGQPPYVLAGGPNFQSEVANILELGYRAQYSPMLSYAATLFQAEQQHLRSLAPTGQGLQFENGIEGRTRGLEVWARWRVVESWRLDAGVVLLRQNLHVASGASDVGSLAALGNDSRRHGSVRSSLDLGRAWRWDVDVRYVGERPNPVVPAYTTFDTRIGWKATPALEVLFGVQNLLDPRHAEWGVATNRVEIERGYFVQPRFQP